MKTILVTGGAGYIGSHTVVNLLNNGFEVIVVDDYSNSNPNVIKAINNITGKEIKFYEYNICDKKNIENIFNKHKIDAVINFAGYKAVGESVSHPLSYYNNNMGGLISLLEVMSKFNVYNLVFSSSATVYGEPKKLPITETTELGATNPYARTKLFNEGVLKDLVQSNNKWNIISLRYFNPLGAHKSGDLGEDPTGTPNNLAPYITQVAIGKREILQVFGNDYNTKDGTCIRDYVHVNDLAYGHTLALKKIFDNKISGYSAINLGSGEGYSVFEIIKAFEEVIKEKIPYKVIGRRPGDIDSSVASNIKAKQELEWEPHYTLIEMCEDSWRWQQKHPNGYNN